MVRSLRARRVIYAVGCAWLAVSCGKDATDPEPALRIEVTPPALTLHAGETRGLEAQVLGETAASASGARVFWSSEHSSVATVSQAGVVTAVAPGSTTVAASLRGQAALVAVTVTAVPVAFVRLSPASAALRAGLTMAFHAEAILADGAAASGRLFTWNSSNAAVASADTEGVVTGVAAGDVTISASVDGVRGSAMLTVQPPAVASISVSPSSGAMLVGQFLQLGAVIRDAAGSPLVGYPITWSSSSAAVATVSSTGLVIALSAGSATITGVSEGKSDTAKLTVSLVPVARVSVVPQAATLARGKTAQFFAQVLDSVGGALNGRTVVWSSDQPGVASVSGAGLVTAIADGPARITATSEQVSGSAGISVTPTPVASLVVTPSTVALRAGATQQLTATARDAQGIVLANRIIDWISGGPTVVSVDHRGLATAIGAGTALIVATSEEQRATVTVTVTPVTVATVGVSAPMSTLMPGGTLQLNASIMDDRGTPIPGKVATWTSNTPAVATVSQAGLVTALAAGTAGITAASDGVSGTINLTILPVPVVAVVVSPTTTSLRAGESVQLTATAHDGNGNVISGRFTTWSSSAPGVATVSANGLVTAVAAGSAQVAASVDGLMNAAVVTVILPVVAAVSVTLTPDPVSVVETGTATVTATVRDAGGAVVAGATVSFAVADASVASVSATGVLTGLRAGTTTITASAAAAGQAPPVTATVGVTILPSAVGRVVVAAPPGTIHIGSLYARQMTAQAFDANNNPISGTPIVWTSGNSALSVTGAGGAATITAVGVPTKGLQVIATLPGKVPVADTVMIDSDVVPIARLDVTPASATLFPLQAQPLIATVQDSAGNAIGSSSGNPLGSRIVTWSLTNGVALVSPTVGMTTTVTAVLPGSVVVDAAISGQTATSVITVSLSATVDTITALSPGKSPSIRIGPGAGNSDREKFLVIAPGGRALSNYPFTVSSSNPAVVTVAPWGSAFTDRTGEGEFSATLTAQAKKGDTADITVNAGGKQTVWKLTVK